MIDGEMDHLTSHRDGGSGKRSHERTGMMKKGFFLREDVFSDRNVLVMWMMVEGRIFGGGELARFILLGQIRQLWTRPPLQKRQ